MYNPTVYVFCPLLSFYMIRFCRHLPASYTKISFTFIVNYLLLQVLMKFWRKLSEDGDDAETCSS
jgi:hypothetical protein